MRIVAAIALFSLTGCLKQTFVDRPAVTRIDDRRPIPKPEEREFVFAQYMGDVLFMRSTTHKLGLPLPTVAEDTNALDEVPDSTWFTNRDIAALTPQELARGPVETGPPQRPFTVVDGKSSGGNPGFFMEDGTGRRFLVKWDTKENPYQQTAAGIIVNRLFWGFGYNVPSDTLFHFDPAELVIHAEAEAEDDRGKDVPMTRAHLDEVLATAPTIDGGVRAIASELLPGEPLGGIAVRGVRTDDPNDRVPHEKRRTLRGMRALAAWVTHSDMKEDNTLDIYVGEEGRGHVEHYLIDFGESLGGHQSEHGRLEDGFQHIADLEGNGLAILTLGLNVRPWERQELTPWPEELGMFAAEPFDPPEWKEAYPYPPFREATAADLFWGARRVMAFDRAQLEAVVAEAHYPDPAAATYLVDTLIARQHAVGQAWITGTTSLADFSLDQGELCMTDVAVELGLVATSTVGFKHQGRWQEAPVDAQGRVCIATEAGDYQVVLLRSIRPDGRQAPIEVHYRATGDQPRVLGVLRDRP